MSSRIAVFTGAGASKSDGAPLQTELFRTFFEDRSQRGDRVALRSGLERFFKGVFSVDPSSAGGFPTFEEALGVLDLAILKEEGILGLGQREAIGDLRQLRRQLVLALAVAVAGDDSIVGSKHAALVRSLRDTDRLDNCAFVTTNYDTLLDDAIEAEGIAAERGTGSLVDYGLSGVLNRAADRFEETRKFRCFKLHGSLNWLCCPVCDVLDVTYASSGVTRLVDDPGAAQCPLCETLRTPVIVPPSYYKDLSNVHLSIVWNLASRMLQQADQLVFCGYSFPDADMHVKYMLKRAQLNRDSSAAPLRVHLVNHHPNKDVRLVDEELSRFRRFFGQDVVTDTHLSFEEFVSLEQIEQVLGR